MFVSLCFLLFLVPVIQSNTFFSGIEDIEEDNEWVPGNLIGGRMSSTKDGSVRYSAEKAFDANPDTNAVSQDNIAVWFYGQLSERFSSLRLTIHGYNNKEWDTYRVQVTDPREGVKDCGNYEPMVEAGNYIQTIDCSKAGPGSWFTIKLRNADYETTIMNISEIEVEVIN